MKEQDLRFMPMMKPPCTSCPMHQAAMQDEMDGMYPQIYMLIYPHIKHHCHMMELKHGHMHHYTREEIEEICEEILKLCEKDINDYYDKDEDIEHEHSHDHNQRSYRNRRRRIASDLVTILVLREMLGRRRRPHFRQYDYTPPHHAYMAPPYYNYMPQPCQGGTPYRYRDDFDYFK